MSPRNQPLRRFEYESQILGRLRHHGIAQIYEAGTWDGGEGSVPWFAMEYIPNAKFLNQYAEAHHLSVHERLALFVKVCHAVHHGHQKGIIHRDLKPGNILVDPSGEPKVIDFGVARSTDSDIAVTTMQTSVGQLIGTVQYMSPEQCDADPDDLDIRSDVYTLGVILYELLTGSMPYQFGNKALHEAARAIKEDAPNNPSTINRQLRGDAETIVLTALEKERERRYQSAQALADDIDRYLRGDPITARPPSMLYQLRIIARKNKAAAVMSLAVLAILIVAIVLVSFLAVSQGRQKSLADTARLAADQRATEAATARAEADANAEEARVASEHAETQAEEARRATETAELNAGEAEQARLEAVTATAALLEASTNLERNAYIASLVRAQNALAHEHHGKAGKLLAESPEQYHNWEWDMLSSQADQSLSKTVLESTLWNRLSPDGKYLYMEVSGNPRGQLRILEIATGEEHELDTGMPGRTNTHNSANLSYWWGVEFSDDSRYITTHWFAWDNTNEAGIYLTETLLKPNGGLRVWDLNQDEPELIIDRSTPTPSAAFKPGTHHLAWTRIEGLEPGNMPEIVHVLSEIDNTIVVEDVRDPGKTIEELPGQPGVAKTIMFSPNGRFMGTRRDYHGYSIMDTDTDTYSVLLHPGMTDTPSSYQWIGFSGDSRYFYSGSLGTNVICLWEVESAEPVPAWSRMAQFSKLAPDPTGGFMVINDPMGTIHVRTIPDGETIGTLNGHVGRVNVMGFNKEDRLVTFGEDGTLRTWGRDTSRHPNPRIFQIDDTIKNLDLRQDGRLLIIVAVDSLQVWDMELNRKIVELPLENTPRDIQLSPDGRYVAMTTSNADRPVDIWDLQTGWPITGIEGKNSILDQGISYLGMPLRFNSTGSMLAWGLGNQVFVMYLDSEEGEKPTLTTVDDARYFHELRFSEDESSLLAIDDTGKITEWNMATGLGTEILPHLTLNDVMIHMAISPTAGLRAGGGMLGTIVLTSFDDPEREGDIIIPGMGNRVRDMDFSRDGSRLSVIGQDGTLILIDTQTGDEVLFLSTIDSSESEDEALAVLKENLIQFGDDEQTLVIGSGNELFIWNSMPVSERYERRKSAEQRLLMARAIADGLLTGDADLEQVVNSVRSDPAIDENLRHVALMEILLRSSAWPLVEEGRLDEAKGRQMAIYKQLRAKYGLQDRRTQHTLAGLIHIYEEMGKTRSAYLLKKTLTDARDSD